MHFTLTQKEVDMDKAYDTPRWAQVLLWMLILAGCVAPLFAQRPPPKINCQQATYPNVMCEANYVFPSDAIFIVYIGDVRGDYEKGITVYITLPDDVFARIEVHIEKQVVVFYGRWHDHQLQFHK